MHSKKEIKYIEKNKSKILLKMKENSNEYISLLFYVCEACLKQNSIKIINLILGFSIFNHLILEKKNTFTSYIIQLLENSIEILKIKSKSLIFY